MLEKESVPQLVSLSVSLPGPGLCWSLPMDRHIRISLLIPTSSNDGLKKTCGYNPDSEQSFALVSKLLNLLLLKKKKRATHALRANYTFKLSFSLSALLKASIKMEWCIIFVYITLAAEMYFILLLLHEWTVDSLSDLSLLLSHTLTVYQSGLWVHVMHIPPNLGICWLAKKTTSWLSQQKYTVELVNSLPWLWTATTNGNSSKKWDQPCSQIQSNP